MDENIVDPDQLDQLALSEDLDLHCFPKLEISFMHSALTIGQIW